MVEKKSCRVLKLMRGSLKHAKSRIMLHECWMLWKICKQNIMLNVKCNNQRSITALCSLCFSFSSRTDAKNFLSLELKEDFFYFCFCEIFALSLLCEKLFKNSSEFVVLIKKPQEGLLSWLESFNKRRSIWRKIDFVTKKFSHILWQFIHFFYLNEIKENYFLT